MNKLVGDGTFVKSVAKNGNKLVVTMSKGAPVEIELSASTEGVVTINKETGEILVDGTASGFFAVKDAKGQYKNPYVNAEGELITFNEKGEEVKTGIMKVAAVKNADGSYTLKVGDVTINLPSAANAVTNVVVTSDAKLVLNNMTYAYDDGEISRENWKGTKALPADDQVVVNNIKTPIVIKVTPANIDAESMDFQLVNAKGEAVKNVKLNAKKVAKTGNRAAAGDNSAEYKLTMEQVVLSADEFKTFDAQFGSNDATKATMLALSANGVVLTDYILYAQNASETELDAGGIDNVALQLQDSKGTQVTGAQAINREELYTVKVTAGTEQFYDMWLDINKDQRAVFGVVDGDAPCSFKVTKKPTDAQKLTVTAYAINNIGEVTKLEENKLSVSNVIGGDEVAYSTIEHKIVPDGSNKNFFVVDLTPMKTALGENLAKWNTTVDGFSVQLFKDKACQHQLGSTNNAASVFGNAVALYADKELKTLKSAFNAETAKDINYIKFAITNATATGSANENNLEPDTEYFIKLSFTDGGQLVNKIVVPVKFTLPEVASMYEANKLFDVKDGVFQAYLSGDKDDGKPAFDIAELYTKKPTDVAYDVTAIETIKTDKISETVAFNLTNLKLLGEADETTSLLPAYGKVITIKATTATYETWTYAPTAKNTYEFKLNIMSPYYEGSVTKEEVYNLNYTDLISTNGGIIPSSKLFGTDYRGVRYELKGDGDATYTVVPSTYVANIERKAKPDADAIKANPKLPNEDYFKVSLTANHTHITKTTVDTPKITVTDKWGFKKTYEIKVNILFGADEKK